MPPNTPSRGDIWFVELDPIVGHEQAGIRPALILSVDSFNASQAGLVTILPITSKAKAIRSRVEVQPPEGGLSMSSWVICEEIRTLSTCRFGRRLGAVSSTTMTKVEAIVRVLLGL